MSRSDSSLSQTLQSIGDATYDFLIAFFGSIFVVFLLLLVVNDAAGTPVSESLIGVVALVFAFGASYLFVAGPWLLDRFTKFVLIFFISVVGLALLSAIPLLAVGGVPSDSLVDRVATIAVVMGSLVIAVVNTYLRPLYAGKA